MESITCPLYQYKCKWNEVEHKRGFKGILLLVICIIFNEGFSEICNEQVFFFINLDYDSFHHFSFLSYRYE